MRESCLGSCVAQNYHEAQSLTAPFWFCHRPRQRGMFPASRLVRLFATQGLTDCAWTILVVLSLSAIQGRRPESGSPGPEV